ncbi:2-succinyl-6-hydroxy-2,4-cyclohexadiene-1-carboxylate synthase [Alicyclobacillus sp. TC]|uniref:Putative 2-succinyl-6-hydroxy-2,4-cyclohexadiene-1-carboxylate synthase n=2 Tax=Alicyclobacillus tolerans TaxID=90970 RepID=A0ABT9LT32_9BACL|nr:MULTISPECIES: 2-succinyl-6-hydroxy-2,4-cyclohexadiene-1-carboxylate synthase [Alicyclobacillus]MDP9727433.1 2-succinyl-6-hydroxy-2,4-cyclohexadiene-1-carboxylate synthase [Alicyclobacillus tengchongensis]QRF23156.1 2-succinyl-6-hydroxy-2,4-cyclohexadiene-1-carboxylate synthase [Alicyclobacillus sp. TC]SHJ48815.1 2-succinyl-6-hydroxy-2,4-cyclohexadiene-1-carboxylate synthase [Alicyclobacillus montanus]
MVNCHKERKRLKVRGCTYRVDVFKVAEDSDRVPLVLLHGFSLSGRIFSFLAEKLSKKGQVITIDLLGHGDTEAPLQIERYQMSEQVKDLTEIFYQLQLTHPVLHGYSMGARVALCTAVMSERHLSGLVLESGSPGLFNAEERATRRESDEQLAVRIEREGVDSFSGQWITLPLFATQSRADRQQLAIQDSIRRNQNALGLAHSLRGIGTGAQPSMWDEISRISCQTLLLTGNEDQKFTHIAGEMLKKIPQATHHVIEQCGHAVYLEQPEQWLKQIENFWAACSQEGRNL